MARAYRGNYICDLGFWLEMAGLIHLEFLAETRQVKVNI